MSIIKSKSDIVIFIDNLSNGGAERIALELYYSLPDRISRNLVTIYNFDPTYRRPKQIECLISDTLPRNKINKAVIIIKKMIQYIKEWHPKIIISLNLPANTINMCLSFITNVIPIMSVHGMPSQHYSYLDRHLKRIIFFLSKIRHAPIIAVSNGVKDELCRTYKIPQENIIVIHNPINIKEIQEMCDEYTNEIITTNMNIPTIITVGRLAAIKGQWHLIRVFAEVRKNMEINLIIVGRGEEEQYLRKIVAEYNIEKDVIFTGWQNNPYKFIKKSTLFVLSSLSEALPNVLIEAMAVGCPIIATNCSSGISEILGSNNECGIITDKMSGIRHPTHEPLDNGELKLFENIVTLLKNAELRKQMSIACKERAKQFDVNIGIQKYAELIDRVSNNINLKN